MLKGKMMVFTLMSLSINIQGLYQYGTPLVPFGYRGSAVVSTLVYMPYLLTCYICMPRSRSDIKSGTVPQNTPTLTSAIMFRVPNGNNTNQFYMAP